MNPTNIIRKQIPVTQRLSHTERLFGMYFPWQLELTIYGFADRLCEDYKGGYWEFYELTNCGFYMSPNSDTPFNVSCDNGYEGELSVDACGIVCCLYTYSHLSFSNKPKLAEVCARQFHWLRDYALDHAEVGSILAAID